MYKKHEDLRWRAASARQENGSTSAAPASGTGVFLPRHGCDDLRRLALIDALKAATVTQSTTRTSTSRAKHPIASSNRRWLQTRCLPAQLPGSSALRATACAASSRAPVTGKASTCSPSGSATCSHLPAGSAARLLDGPSSKTASTCCDSNAPVISSSSPSSGTVLLAHAGSFSQQLGQLLQQMGPTPAASEACGSALSTAYHGLPLQSTVMPAAVPALAAAPLVCCMADAYAASSAATLSPCPVCMGPAAGACWDTSSGLMAVPACSMLAPAQQVPMALLGNLPMTAAPLVAAAAATPAPTHLPAAAAGSILGLPLQETVQQLTADLLAALLLLQQQQLEAGSADVLPYAAPATTASNAALLLQGSMASAAPAIGYSAYLPMAAAAAPTAMAGTSHLVGSLGGMERIDHTAAAAALCLGRDLAAGAGMGLVPATGMTASHAITAGGVQASGLPQGWWPTA